MSNMNKYKTIVIDPPWQYSRFPTSHSNGTKPIEGKPLPYKSMSIYQLENLPVTNLADNDCRLFLWSTNRYLPEAIHLLNHWGFTYKQFLVWHKTINPSPFPSHIAPIRERAIKLE